MVVHCVQYYFEVLFNVVSVWPSKSITSELMLAFSIFSPSVGYFGVR